jgi:hypothetical protein
VGLQKTKFSTLDFNGQCVQSSIDIGLSGIIHKAMSGHAADVVEMRARYAHPEVRARRFAPRAFVAGVCGTLI